MPNSGRYFLHDFKASGKLYSANPLFFLVSNLIPLSFAGAIISFYWFLLRPLLNSGNFLFFSSPHFYVVILWTASNLIAFSYIWLELRLASREAGKARQEKENLGHYLFEVESELQDVLPAIPLMMREGELFLSNPTSKDTEHEETSEDGQPFYFSRRVILWELYDWYLDRKS
jgi:hypothetical protein